MHQNRTWLHLLRVASSVDGAKYPAIAVVVISHVPHKAPSHQASASTDGYVHQHFRRHAMPTLSVHKPITLDDTGDSTLAQHKGNAYAWCEWAYRVRVTQAWVVTIIFLW